MANHPNRSGTPQPGATPPPDAIRAARTAAGHTQSEAARLIYSTLRAWQDWEAGARRMHPAMFELYLLRTQQHPTLLLLPKGAAVNSQEVLEQMVEYIQLAVESEQPEPALFNEETEKRLGFVYAKLREILGLPKV